MARTGHHRHLGERERHPLLGLVVAILLPALAYGLCVALGLPSLVGAVAAALLVLAGIPSGGFGFGGRPAGRERQPA